MNCLRLQPEVANVWTGLSRKIKIEKFRRALAKALRIETPFRFQLKPVETFSSSKPEAIHKAKEAELSKKRLPFQTVCHEFLFTTANENGKFSITGPVT